MVRSLASGSMAKVKRCFREILPFWKIIAENLVLRSLTMPLKCADKPHGSSKDGARREGNNSLNASTDNETDERKGTRPSHRGRSEQLRLRPQEGSRRGADDAPHTPAERLQALQGHHRGDGSRQLLTLSLTLSLTASAQFRTIGHVDSRPQIKEKPATIAATDTTAIDNRIVSNDREETPAEPSTQAWCHPPLKGALKISSRFGTRRNPFGKGGHEHHSGLDLSAKSGTPIYAMLPGEVLAIGNDPRSGNYIKLKHGNFTVSYCHLIRKPSLKMGSHVFPGQPVAQVGSTGLSTGPHLHITLKRNGRVLDPAILLDFFKF